MLTVEDKEQLKSLYITLCEASIEHDYETLDQILDDEYVLIHMTGMRQNKKAYINALGSRMLEYYKSDYERIEIGEYAEGIAKIDARSRVDAAVFGGTRRIWRLRQIIIARKKEGEWKLLESEASTY